jgi:hypothetical protein
MQLPPTYFDNLGIIGHRMVQAPALYVSIKKAV